MDILSKIFRQTFWQFIGKVVSSVSTFIILGIIARNYHEKGTGVFTLALTYLAIFNLLSDFGFNAHVLKRVQKDWRKLLGVRLLWSVALTIIAISLLLFLPFTTDDFIKAVIFGNLTIVGSGIFITCNLIFQSKHRYDLSVFSSSLGTLIGLGLYVWFTSLSFPISVLLAANSLSWIVIAFLSLVVVKKFLQSIMPVFDLSYIKNLFQETWPIAATLTLNVVYFRIDSFMISYFKGVSDVGIYNLAYSVFQSALVLPTFIMNSYYPLMLKSLKGVKFVGLGLLGLAALGTLLTLILAPEIIKILTGGGFAGSQQALQILSLGFPAFFLSSLLMWWLIAKGRYKTLLLIYGSGLIFNLILNFIYIPRFSYMAASFITVISEYLILLLLVVSLF